MFKHSLIYFLIKYLFLMTEKCVSAHSLPPVGHYNLFMKLIRLIVAMMPIKM